jgi:hypothetical protein
MFSKPAIGSAGVAAGAMFVVAILLASAPVARPLYNAAPASLARA